MGHPTNVADVAAISIGSRRNIGTKCGGYYPDLYKIRPPDLPPSFSGLHLLNSGKADMLLVEPVEV